ncbi:hypothetical protein V6N13_011522 [Hibiscus sabdariffa]|uniref:B box-type domain-containing protein n=1 Tax=Hibiscus sabdariffa TaxID=183260 RepID=A0ABR2SCM7_9ROSI
MKRCELYNNLGRIYCESDVAILCWDCDSIVHGANFLVARHLRTLLCHRCQSPTSRYGSGPMLASTLFALVCSNCIKRSACAEEINNTDDDDDGGDSSSDDEENQVVSWPRMQPFSSYSECFNSTMFGSTHESASQSSTVVPVKPKRDTMEMEPASRGYSASAGCSLSANQDYKTVAMVAGDHMKKSKILLLHICKRKQNLFLGW